MKWALITGCPGFRGEIGAREGTLSIMVGGEQKVFDRVKPLFDITGKNITTVGGNGDGQTCKVANQIIVALNIEAVSEALVFASKAGADPVRVRRVNGRVRLFTHSGSSRRAHDQPDVRARFQNRASSERP